MIGLQPSGFELAILAPTPVEAAGDNLLDFSDEDNSMYLALLFEDI